MDAKDLGRPDEAVSTYYVPTRSTGYAYISRFIAASGKGRLFLQEPSDECLRQVVFDPNTVKEKAWIVYINYMLLSMVSTDPNRSGEASHFRSNVHLALNNASIFLTPSIANVQTLAILATHGEDFASPSQSWMLFGHACRQAEALQLYRAACPHAGEDQRRLCLFWLLFIMDKSCALAFGRPPLLRTSVYGSTPLPDYEFLARNCPHICESVSEGGIARRSDFGARFYWKSFELVKLIGTILEVTTASKTRSDRDPIRQQLDGWYKSIEAELNAALEAERSITTVTQQKEMALGIRSFKFQYLHLLIVLLRDDVSRSALRIASAREALSILPEMVSNWDSVYNGVMWQLLYLPFTPFFVIFGHILSDSAAWTVNQDIQLLRSTVTYFESMCNQLRLLSTLATRLAHTAGVFVQLVNQHVRASAPQTSSGIEHTDDLANLDLETIEAYLAWLPEDLANDLPIAPSGSTPGFADTSAESRRSGPNRSARRYDDTFDWFTWDAYYSGGDAQLSRVP